jgi:hypothetical protein
MSSSSAPAAASTDPVAASLQVAATGGLSPQASLTATATGGLSPPASLAAAATGGRDRSRSPLPSGSVPGRNMEVSVTAAALPNVRYDVEPYVKVWTGDYTGPLGPQPYVFIRIRRNGLFQFKVRLYFCFLVNVFYVLHHVAVVITLNVASGRRWKLSALHTKNVDGELRVTEVWHPLAQ